MAAVGRFEVMAESFVPADFPVPVAFDGPGFRLEPLGPEHNERDHAAWMTSIDHIKSTPGFESAPEWPAPMDLPRNLADLVEHAADFENRRGFTYSILDGDEVIGCVYIYPSRRPDHDAEVRSWVRASRSVMDARVRRVLSDWIERVWPFANPYYAARA